MKPREFYILDVFSAGKYTGNQLAVVMASDAMTTDGMQSIAREINFSETTFISPSGVRDGRVGVRIFTPGREVPFAGHPTLGTAYVALKYLMQEGSDDITLELKAGPVYVRKENDGRLRMRQLVPSFGRTLGPNAIALVLGLGPDDIDTLCPVEEVSTGLPFVIVPLKSQSALKSIKLDHVAYESLTERLDAKAIYTFFAEGRDKINARMFAPAFGIAEDPATGSAAGCLAAYLLRHKVLGSGPVKAVISQGVEIGRPSLIFIEAEDISGEIVIHVAGNVTEVARGVLL